MNEEKEITAEEKLAKIQADREARAKERKEEYNKQRVIDLTAFAELEDKYGATRVAYLDVEHSPGLPTLIACKAPNEAQVKKYRTRYKDGSPSDRTFAVEEIAAQTRIYPPRDMDPGNEDAGGDALYKKLLDERPGIHTALGLAALKLVSAKAKEEGKD